MTYRQTRDSEQLSHLDDAIGTFISRYNNNLSTTDRKTIILFPGGMGSQLLRATTPESDGPPYFYNTLWLDCAIIFGAALHLQMQGDIDFDEQIIIPDGPVGPPLAPYQGFINWCDHHDVDYLIFGWDWRRDLCLTADFFLNVFMPLFEQRVKHTCTPNPLQHLSLVGHSFGGMIVKLILNRSNNPYVQLVHSAVTVASPFYGYGGQLPRYFVGDPDLNPFCGKRRVTRLVSSLAAGYTLLPLDEATYQRDSAKLGQDPDDPLLYYPCLDANDGTVADPYNPKTKGGLVRYPQNYGFDAVALNRGKLICQQVAALLDPQMNNKFFNIRGIQFRNGAAVNDTIHNQTWDWIAPNFDPQTGGCPITDYRGLGDGTLPAWSTRFVHLPQGHVLTLKGDVDHTYMMSDQQVLNTLAMVI
jgi:pimeloyl-ACP methyl ester carboxylesterase